MNKIFKAIRENKWTALIVMIIIGFGSYYLFQSFNEGDDSAQKNEIEKIEKGDIKIVVNGSGQVQAESQVDLKPQIAGDGVDIIEVLVENNQAVKEGDIIAILDSGEAEEKIRDAQLSLSSAQIQYAETAREFDNKTLEESWKRDSAQNTVDQKTNALNDAYEDLADYKIEAPFDGIVTGLDVEVGDSISRDEILASIITEKLQAEISLNEIDAVKVENGSTAVLTFDVLGEEEVSGEVSKIDTIGGVNSGVVSYDVVISFVSPSDLLKPGMSVEVDIETEKAEDVLLLPVAAVKEDQKGGSYVLVAGANYSSDSAEADFERRTVETGITDDVNVEIKSGLTEGELVVTGQASASNSGQKSTEESTSLIPTMGGGGGRR